MSAWCFANVTEEVVNAIKENSVPMNTNDATKLCVTLVHEGKQIVCTVCIPESPLHFLRRLV